MEIDDRVKQLEDEIKVLKNEVQAVLLDIRESYLNRENPFNPEVSAIPISPVIAITTGQQAMQPPVVRKGPDVQVLGTDLEDGPADIAEMDDVVSTRKQSRRPEVENLSDEEESAYEELDTSEETAQEEVNTVLESDVQPASHSRPRRTNGSSRGNGKVDLITIAGLTQWVTDTVKRLGREKTETIIDVSEVVGLLAPELKNLLAKFVDRTSDEYNGSATMRDYIASLIELERLLGMNIKSDEIALLSIICQEAQP